MQILLGITEDIYIYQFLVMQNLIRDNLHRNQPKIILELCSVLGSKFPVFHNMKHMIRTTHRPRRERASSLDTQIFFIYLNALLVIGFISSKNGSIQHKGVMLELIDSYLQESL